MRRVFFLLLLLVGVTLSKAQSAFVPSLLEGVDTVFVEVDAKQQKLLHHKVQKGQTVYSLSKFYGLTVEEVYHFNTVLKDQAMSVDQVVKIPLPNRALVRRWEDYLAVEDFVSVFYEVKKGETMYSVSRSYFNVTPALMQHNNQKETTDLNTGEHLLVGWLSRKGIIDTLQQKKIPVNPTFSANTSYRNKYFKHLKTKKESQENGIAFWKHKEKPSKTVNFFALHRDAPLKSILKITNPMTNRVYYAKVTGRIPTSVYDETIVVVIDPSLAKALGAIDPKFHVKIAYFE